jgi:hypothetical protein
MDDITRTSLSLELAEISGKMSELKVAAVEADREFTASEQRKYNKFQAEAEALEDRLERAATMERELRRVPRSGAQDGPGAIGHPSLLVSSDNLRKHANAIREGGTFGAVEERANVTVEPIPVLREVGALPKSTNRSRCVGSPASRTSRSKVPPLKCLA